MSRMERKGPVFPLLDSGLPLQDSEERVKFFVLTGVTPQVDGGLRCLERVRSRYPGYSSTLEGVAARL